MSLNPMKLLKLKENMNKFTTNHPKFSSFLGLVAQSEIQEGTILEVTVKYPDGKVVSSNLQLQQSDLEMIKDLKDLM